MISRAVVTVVAGCMMIAVTVAGFVYGAITAITEETWPEL